MKLKYFIKKLDSLKDELKEKEVCVVAPNGLLVEPQIKYEQRDLMKVLDFSDENIERIVLHWE